MKALLVIVAMMMASVGIAQTTYVETTTSSPGNVTLIHPGKFSANGFHSTSSYGLEIEPASGDAVIRRKNAGTLAISSGGGTSDVRFNYNYQGGSGGIRVYDGGTTNYTNLKTTSDGHLVVTSNGGNVGIGGLPSTNKLYVDGNIVAKQHIVVSKGGSYRVAMNGVADGYIVGRNDNIESMFVIHSDGPTYFNGGNVGIGTDSPDEKLTVKGTVHAEEVKVDLTVPGPDYVFEKDYPLPALEEVKAYIDEHEHLPEVPSAKEMEEEGVNVGEMEMVLLKKVEELTLYVIDLEQTNAQIRNQNGELIKRLELMEARLSDQQHSLDALLEHLRKDQSKNSID